MTRTRFPIELGSRGSIFMLAETASFKFGPPKYHPSKLWILPRLTWWILSRKLTKFPRLAFA